MSNIYDDLPDRKAPQRIWSALIASNPVDQSDLVSVTIPGLNDEGQQLRWESCRWQARNDTDVPARGDKCLVIIDDNNEVWVVAWWPF